MKKIILLVFFMSFFSSKAQKVDLDRFYFDVSYQILPKEYVPLEKRTFATTVKLGGAIQSIVDQTTINDKIDIFGWKKVNQNPTVDIEFNLEDFVEKGASTKTRVEEIKDKDGKVTSRKNYYYVLSKYTTRGYAKVKGPITPVPLTEKQIEEEKAKQASVASNRFLKNVAVKKDTVSSKDGLTVGFSQDLEYKSKEYTDSEKPLVDFYINKSAIRDKTLRDFVESSQNTFRYVINSTYGFTPKYDKQILWILDAKSDEGQTQVEAIQAVKSLFATMKADEPIGELKVNMQPLIEYFDSLKTKYAEDNKPSRKMRYSAYYNLAVIYMMLDEPGKAIAESEKLIVNDYDKSDGKVFIEQATKLLESFKAAKTNTRHNPALK
jgi:phosphopantetheine adenylyltransferase